jgi:hypothetical protein
MRLGVIRENTPHTLRGNRKKMIAILPMDSVLPGEFQVCFIDQRSRLQSVAGSLTSQVRFGEAAKLSHH